MRKLFKKCDPDPPAQRPPLPRSSSFGSDFSMYVTPDCPLRDTPEKAAHYYKVLWALMDKGITYNDNTFKDASQKDIEAAEKLLNA